MSDGDVRISRLQPGELDLVEPLWSALREHHASIAPQHGPTRSRAESWARRSAKYRAWLERSENFLLLARRGDAVVGYALVVMNDEAPTWPGRSGCLETLSVHPDARGSGIGSQLIAAARASLAEQGVPRMTIDVIAGNDDAVRFYARHGFTPFVQTLRGDTATGA